MKQYKKGYELKNTAKDRLDGKYGSAMLLYLAEMLITFGVTVFVNSLSPSRGPLIPLYIFRSLIDLIVNWILGVMSLGINLFFLNAACGQPYSVNDIFYGYKNDYRKALTVSGVLTLLATATTLPSQFLLDMFRLTQEPGWAIAALVVAVICYCVFTPLTLGLSLSFYLMLDFPDKTAKDVLSLSMRLMQGHKMRLFLLQLSFLPLILLCVCSLFIGFLWLLPYMAMTMTCFFLDLMNPKEQPASQ